MTTTKVELDVKLFVCTTEVLAEVGDQIMIYNDAVIGVIPRNTRLSPVEAISQARPKPSASAETPTFSSADVQHLLNTIPEGLTTREINKRLGYTGTAAAWSCSTYLNEQAKAGNINPTGSKRFPTWVVPSMKEAA